MGAQTMLNVRIDKSLKAEGDSVLARAGMSVTEAIRSLYRYLGEHQEVPACCLDTQELSTAAARREKMRSLVGVAPVLNGEDAYDLKRERLSRLEFE